MSENQADEAKTTAQNNTLTLKNILVFDPLFPEIGILIIIPILQVNQPPPPRKLLRLNLAQDKRMVMWLEMDIDQQLWLQIHWARSLLMLYIRCFFLRLWEVWVGRRRGTVKSQLRLSQIRFTNRHQIKEEL